MPTQVKFLIISICIFATGNSTAQELMTVGEVFDFQINDEFHREYGPTAPPNAERLKVVDKYYSDNNDTLYYCFHDFSYSSFPVDAETMEYEFTDDTITRAYPHPDSSIVIYDTVFMHDTIYDTHDCGRITNAYYYQIGGFEPMQYAAEYGSGLGLCYQYENQGGNDSGLSTTLFYYKKGSETCGTPDLTSDISSFDDSDRVSVYPNPAKGRTWVKSNLVMKRIKMYNALGQNVITCHPNTKHANINLSHLKKGNYYLEIINYNSIYRTQLIVE
jgi:hypothetical protein